MNKTLFFLAMATTAFLGACSGSDGEIEVASASAPLTANANDALFTIDVVDARTDGYALEGLVVNAIPKDKDAVKIAFTVGDTNHDGKLDKGDTLSCTEGATNVFGPDLGGTEIAIELRAQVDGEDTLVGKATWTPPK